MFFTYIKSFRIVWFLSTLIQWQRQPVVRGTPIYKNAVKDNVTQNEVAAIQAEESTAFLEVHNILYLLKFFFDLV